MRNANRNTELMIGKFARVFRDVAHLAVSIARDVGLNS